MYNWLVQKEFRLQMNFDQGSTFFFPASVLALLPPLCMSVLSSVWTSKQKQNGIGNIGSYICVLYHPEQDKAPGFQNTAVCSLVYTGPIFYPGANHCGETSEIMLTGSIPAGPQGCYTMRQDKPGFWGSNERLLVVGTAESTRDPPWLSL